MNSDELYALLRRRGVLWPSSEIYGGAQGLYDYGPLGAALKRRIEDAWRAWFLGLSDDYYEIDPAELLPEAVVRASGHLENFTDPEVVCDGCHRAYRADTILESARPEGVDGLSSEAIADLVRRFAPRCPACGAERLRVPRPFNLMFGLEFGAAAGDRAYLRPETAQNSYLAFARMWEVGRKALPLGIAVVGKAFRNEIAPRQILYRLRAFTQAELQIFFDPERWTVPIDVVRHDALPLVLARRRAAGDESIHPTTVEALVREENVPEFFAYHLAMAHRFYRDVLGYPAGRLRLFEKSETERAFYNRLQFDVEVNLDSLGGFREVGAVHYRGDYDLSRHSAGSGRDLAVTTGDGRRIVPHVLELTFGVDRNLWALADLHLVRDGERTVWKLPPYLAPLQVAVFPLLKKEHGPVARTIAEELRGEGWAVEYDDAGNVGRRYARVDEAGIPFAVTVDRETIEPGPAQGTVTVRLRDDRSQERLARARLAARLRPAFVFPHPPRAG